MVTMVTPDRDFVTIAELARETNLTRGQINRRLNKYQVPRFVDPLDHRSYVIDRRVVTDILTPRPFVVGSRRPTT